MFGRRGPFLCISGYPPRNFPRGRPFGTALQPGSRLAAAATGFCAASPLAARPLLAARAAPTGGFPAASAGAQARPNDFGGGPAGPPPWAGDFGTGAADAPWAGDLTGPQSGPLTGAPTQAYTPGMTGPQAPYTEH